MCILIESTESKQAKSHFYFYCQGDSDIIFADLDHDGDGKINFEDFSFGFRDFLTPGSRRGKFSSLFLSLFQVTTLSNTLLAGSLQLGLLPVQNESNIEENPKIKSMEVKIVFKCNSWHLIILKWFLNFKCWKRSFSMLSISRSNIREHRKHGRISLIIWVGITSGKTFV